MTTALAINNQGVVVFTAANGDELWALPAVLGPTSDPSVWHTKHFHYDFVVAHPAPANSREDAHHVISGEGGHEKYG